jgi:hypothetical protein
MENRYYEYFKEAVGKGDGQYYANIGEIYRMRPGIQRGYGQFVVGSRLQGRYKRGMGIGSAIMSLFKRAVPLLKVLGSRAVDLASNIAKDTIQGNNVKESAIKHASNEANTLLSNAPSTIANFLNNNTPSMPITVSSQPVTASVGPSATSNRQKSKTRKRKLISSGRSKTGRGFKFPALELMK